MKTLKILVEKKKSVLPLQMWISVSRDEKWAVVCWRHVCGMCVDGQAAVCPHSEEVSDLQLNTGEMDGKGVGVSYIWGQLQWRWGVYGW